MAEQVPFAGDAKLAENPEERCPCVLLLDTSGSMGEIVSGSGQSLGYTIQQDGQTYNAVSGGVTRIDLLNDGLRLYHSEVLADPLAAKRVEVSIITFGGQVETVCPFTTINAWTPPTLKANGQTPMGEAILAAIDAVNNRKQHLKLNGVTYFRPWIFMITDGEPTDSESQWKAAATKIQEGEQNKQFVFFPVAVEGAKLSVLQQLSSARQPLQLKGMNFNEMFRWLSTSQRAVSSSRPGLESTVALPSPVGWAHL